MENEVLVKQAAWVQRPHRTGQEGLWLVHRMKMKYKPR